MPIQRLHHTASALCSYAMRPLRRLHKIATEEEGWSLTELMIVLVIIGILALIALPRFMGVTTKAKMVEAQGMLRQVHTLQEAYYYEHDTYAPTLEALGFEQVPLVSEGGTARYRIEIEAADAASYTATATAVVDFDRDGTFNQWAVDAAGLVAQRETD